MCTRRFSSPFSNAWVRGYLYIGQFQQFKLHVYNWITTLIHSWLPTIEQSHDSFLLPHPTTTQRECLCFIAKLLQIEKSELDNKQHLTVADRCLSRPLSIGLACSGWPSHQNVPPLTAVGGSGAKCCSSEYHSTKTRIWQISTAHNYIYKEKSTLFHQPSCKS